MDRMIDVTEGDLGQANLRGSGGSMQLSRGESVRAKELDRSADREDDTRGRGYLAPWVGIAVCLVSAVSDRVRMSCDYPNRYHTDLRLGSSQNGKLTSYHCRLQGAKAGGAKTG